MTSVEDVEGSEPPKKPQKHYYEYAPEDVLVMLESIKRDVQLVEESDVYKKVGTATYDLKDVVRILDHYCNRIVVEAFKSGSLTWKEPVAMPGTIWPKLMEK